MVTGVGDSAALSVPLAKLSGFTEEFPKIMKDVRLREGEEPKRRRRHEDEDDLGGCAVCREATSEGKPVCKEHLDQIPEIVALTGKISRLDKERERLESRARRVVAKNGLLMSEVIGMRKAKPMSIEKIAQDLDLAEESSRAIVDALVRQGVVRLEKTGRGRMIACLTF